MKKVILNYCFVSKILTKLQQFFRKLSCRGSLLPLNEEGRN